MGLIGGIIIGLIILVILVAVHELGHGIAAKRNGVIVEEFGIGFPPKAASRKLKKSILGKNVIFSLNWLPIGGFVRLKGEHDAANKKGDYGAATFWQKTKILLAGVFMNWVIAAVLLTILALVGMPRVVENQFAVASDAQVTRGSVEVTTVVDDSAAAMAGIETGDVLVRVNNTDVASSQQFVDETKNLAGQTVAVVYERDGAQITKDVTLGDDATQGVFGVGIGQRETTRSTWSAPIVGVALTAQFSWETVQGLGQIIGQLATGVVSQFSGDEATRERGDQDLAAVSQSVAGPIGILGVLFPAASEQGPQQLLLLTAIISLTLAVMNVLPIPALDGGRWFTMAAFKLARKKLTKEREENIQATGFLVLLVLIVLITITDIFKFVG